MRGPAVLLGLLLLGACASADEPEDTATAAPTTAAPESTVEDVSESVDANEAEASAPSAEADESDFPSVIDAVATAEGAGSWRFDVTISSPYDSPERYADAWRVLGPDGTEFGIRVLTHDHASEQPFTRSQSGIAVPEDVQVVTIQGRDLVNGWGGPTLDLTLPEATE